MPMYPNSKWGKIITQFTALDNLWNKIWDKSEHKPKYENGRFNSWYTEGGKHKSRWAPLVNEFKDGLSAAIDTPDFLNDYVKYVTKEGMQKEFILPALKDDMTRKELLLHIKKWVELISTAAATAASAPIVSPIPGLTLFLVEAGLYAVDINKRKELSDARKSVFDKINKESNMQNQKIASMIASIANSIVAKSVEAYNPNDWHVLPIRKVNFSTGANSVVGNIYETWFEQDSSKSWYKPGKPAETLVVFGANGTPYGVIFGAGGHYASRGDIKDLVHDQTGKFIGNAHILFELTFNYGDDLEKFKQEIKSKVGNSAWAFVFK